MPRPHLLPYWPHPIAVNVKGRSSTHSRRGHRYAERVLEDLGARPITSDDDPTVWLTQALATIGAVDVRHPGNHRSCLTLGGRGYARYPVLPSHPSRPTRAAYQPELDSCADALLVVIVGGVGGVWGVGREDGSRHGAAH